MVKGAIPVDKWQAEECYCGRTFDYVLSNPAGDDFANLYDKYCPDCDIRIGSRNMRWYKIKDGIEYG